MTAAIFQMLIDKQLGAVGSALGKPHKVYRLGPISSGDFPDAWPVVAGNVPIHRNRVTSRNLESSLISERTLWYEIAGNMSPFRLGDVFLSTEPSYQPGVAYGTGATSIQGTGMLDGFALAWHGLASPPIGGRIDRRVGIYRPDLTPMAMTDGSKRWAVTHDSDTPLVLTNGTYAWGQTGNPASWLPCGFGSNDREYSHGPMAPDSVGITPAQRYYAYLPILPGYMPSEGDAILTETDERYVLMAPFEQQVGVAGYQFMIERVIGGT